MSGLAPGRVAPLVLEQFYSEDARGNFSKPFAASTVFGRGFHIKEIFWTTSAAGVIRGMHFQLEPQHIGKIVWVSRGSIFDVLVDLRDGEEFGAVTSYELEASSGRALFVPAGFAHGFQSLDDDSIVNYAVDGLFSPEHDAGVRWDSVGVDWPREPTKVSQRDQALPALADFLLRFFAV